MSVPIGWPRGDPGGEQVLCHWVDQEQSCHVPTGERVMVGNNWNLNIGNKHRQWLDAIAMSWRVLPGELYQ